MEGIEEESPVAQPKDFTFCQVNEFVHNPNVYFEDMQGVCLDMADHIDRLREVGKIGIRWLEFWLSQHECESEAGLHRCGRNEREEELRQMKAIVNGQKNAEVWQRLKAL